MPNGRHRIIRTRAVSEHERLQEYIDTKIHEAVYPLASALSEMEETVCVLSATANTLHRILLDISGKGLESTPTSEISTALLQLQGDLHAIQWTPVGGLYGGTPVQNEVARMADVYANRNSVQKQADDIDLQELMDE